MFGEETCFDKFALYVIACGTSDTFNGGGIIGAAHSENDEDPAEAEAESSEKVGSKNGLSTFSESGYAQSLGKRLTNTMIPAL